MITNTIINYHQHHYQHYYQLLPSSLIILLSSLTSSLLSIFIIINTTTIAITIISTSIIIITHHPQHQQQKLQLKKNYSVVSVHTYSEINRYFLSSSCHELTGWYSLFNLEVTIWVLIPTCVSPCLDVKFHVPNLMQMKSNRKLCSFALDLVNVKFDA